ncbi:MAG: hypothetical protein AB7V13_23750 [Pseudorhodoplanes sp.]|uniref:hypothetical protein n=1 Tax=Pseudorhodoplanes sp. TaxID=1934341 RepID=UPI003D0DAFE0
MSKEAKAAPRERASHIVLLADADHRRAGTVLEASDDLIARLDENGVGYRAATPQERRLGGFAD